MLNKYVEVTRGSLGQPEPQGGFMNLRPGQGGVMNIPKMTPEEAADSDAQERAKRAMLFNRSDDEGDPINLTEEQKEQLKKERVELKKIEEMENLIAKAVETSDEEEESEDPEVYKVVESEEEEEIKEVEEVEQKPINPLFSKETRERRTENANKEKLHLKGTVNFLFLLGVISAVLLSGSDSLKFPVFTLFDVSVLKGNLLRDLILIGMAMLSLIFTQNIYRKENGFTWHPIMEVAKLFIGIFITIIPALVILNENQSMFSEMSYSLYFWLTGGLSSFLDNAPTYLVFFEAAGIQKRIEEAGMTAITDNAVLNTKLLAVSIGAVFMGANTYIGNAPNFMVKSIAEESKINMPSFFGFMVWSIIILIPCMILISLLFFN